MPIGKRGSQGVEGADIEARIYVSAFNTMTATIVVSRHKPTLATLHFQEAKVKSIPSKKSRVAYSLTCKPFHTI